MNIENGKEYIKDAFQYFNIEITDKVRFEQLKNDIITLIESQQKTIKELVEHCRDLSVNHDCDNDAHRYDTSCYVCDSKKLYNKYKAR